MFCSKQLKLVFLLLGLLLRQIEVTFDFHVLSLVQRSRNGDHAWIGDTLQFRFPNVFVSADGVLGQVLIVHQPVDLLRLTVANGGRHFILQCKEMHAFANGRLSSVPAPAGGIYPTVAWPTCPVS